MSMKHTMSNNNYSNNDDAVDVVVVAAVDDYKISTLVKIATVYII